MRPRFCWIRPRACISPAIWLTVVRWTASIWARNSWVRSISSRPAWSQAATSQRQNRASARCQARQATDCWAWLASPSRYWNRA